MKRITLPSAALLFLGAVSAATAANWSNWRGPSFDGSTSESGLPVKISKSDSVRWVTDIDGPSASTPVVWGDRVFVSTADHETQTLKALCLDLSDGGIRWTRDIGVGIFRDRRSNYASPSPVTDGELVYFFFGNGELVAFDLDGERIWSRNIQKDYGEFAFQWTFSSSPLLYDGRLYLQVLQRDEPVNGRGRTDGPNQSYLLAMDPKTGRELWRHIRPAEARAESLESFATPVPFVHEGRDEIVIVGGDCITGHNPDNGEEYWRWGTWNPTRIGHWRLVPSPLPAGDVILACAPKGSPVYAVKAGLQGTQDDSALAWVSEEREISSDVSTPLFYQDHIYLLNSDRQVLSCLKPSTGEVLWSGELPTRTKLEASPLGADGKIYMMSMAGEVFVARAGGTEFELLHQAELGEDGDRELRCSIVAANGRLLVRTGTKLYCFEN